MPTSHSYCAIGSAGVGVGAASSKKGWSGAGAAALPLPEPWPARPPPDPVVPPTTCCAPAADSAAAPVGPPDADDDNAVVPRSLVKALRMSPSSVQLPDDEEEAPLLLPLVRAAASLHAARPASTANACTK